MKITIGAVPINFSLKPSPAMRFIPWHSILKVFPISYFLSGQKMLSCQGQSGDFLLCKVKPFHFTAAMGGLTSDTVLLPGNQLHRRTPGSQQPQEKCTDPSCKLAIPTGGFSWGRWRLVLRRKTGLCIDAQLFHTHRLMHRIQHHGQGLQTLAQARTHRAENTLTNRSCGSASTREQLRTQTAGSKTVQKSIKEMAGAKSIKSA